MALIVTSVVLLILAIIVGGTLSFFGGTIATIGMAIAFGLFCIALISMFVSIVFFRH